MEIYRYVRRRNYKPIQIRPYFFFSELDGSFFKGICLQQNSACFLYKDIVNLFFHTNHIYGHLNTGFTLGNCLIGAVKLTKNANPDRGKYSNYGIEFNSC